ncbi:MAG: hypothetical protein IT436_15665 [Phycisphaerales bacterium]|nr:hypothetical protein [Phycisphaerales bacterium]
MRRGSRAWAVIAVVATGVGLSLLIWAKLKVVASVPRSAYAEPERDQQPARGPAGLGPAGPDSTGGR